MSDWVPNFSWIEPDLAVGGRFPAEQATVLAATHGLGAVIDLRSEACDDAAELAGCGLRFLHLPTEDLQGVSQAMLDLGVAFAREMRAEGRRLLVHCEHGIGRSATLALCVLVDRGWAPMAALNLAKDARVQVSPSEAQYRAWVSWISRRDSRLTPPTYHEFGCVAYRHLAQSV
jgi:protein-tyrosine phosphatase